MERVADPLRFAPTAAYVVAGMSRRLGRTVGYVVEAPDFEPQITIAYTSPHTAELPEDPAHVSGIAIAQMAELHRGTPHRGSGVLTIATITLNTIATRRVMLDSSAGPSPANGLSAVGRREGGRPAQEPAADLLPVAATA